MLRWIMELGRDQAETTVMVMKRLSLETKMQKGQHNYIDNLVDYIYIKRATGVEENSLKRA